MPVGSLEPAGTHALFGALFGAHFGAHFGAYFGAHEPLEHTGSHESKMYEFKARPTNRY